MVEMSADSRDFLKDELLVGRKVFELAALLVALKAVK